MPKPPLTPEQALVILNYVSLPALKVEQRITKSVIAAIPPDQGDFQPDDVAKSAMELAWHIVSAAHLFVDGALNGAFDFAGIIRPDSVKTPADLVDWYDRQFAADFERLTRITGDRLTAVLDFRGSIQMPALSFIQLAVNHSIHHRGQLSVYLRPMGAKVPAIYGESYDSKRQTGN
jgi:uncharacterized damage-inducible protein DinB